MSTIASTCRRSELSTVSAAEQSATVETYEEPVNTAIVAAVVSAVDAADWDTFCCTQWPTIP